MMKKIILLLTLITWVNVFANNEYTDYEFQGYTEEKLNDDEFYKYEEIRMNKFYSVEERDIEYLADLVTGFYEYVDPLDFKVKKYYKYNLPAGHYHEGMISIRGESNYMTEEIVLLETFNFNEKVSRVEIYDGDVKLNPTIHVDEEKNQVDIILGRLCFTDNLKIVFHYYTEENYNFIITLINMSGAYRTIAPITLSNKLNTVTVNNLSPEVFSTFIDENRLPYNDILYYYSYDVKFYKHYNLEKTFYKMDESDYLEGYVFYPEESVTMYKIYKRELLNSSDDTDKTPAEEDKIELPTPDNDKNEQDDKNDSKDNTSNSIVINVEAKPEFISREEQNEQEEKNKYPAVVDTTKNENSIKDLSKLNDRVDTLECKENKRALIFKIVGLVLIGISICMLVVHIISVKFNYYND